MNEELFLETSVGTDVKVKKAANSLCETRVNCIYVCSTKQVLLRIPLNFRRHFLLFHSTRLGQHVRDLPGGRFSIALYKTSTRLENTSFIILSELSNQLFLYPLIL